MARVLQQTTASPYNSALWNFAYGAAGNGRMRNGRVDPSPLLEMSLTSAERIQRAGISGRSLRQMVGALVAYNWMPESARSGAMTRIRTTMIDRENWGASNGSQGNADWQLANLYAGVMAAGLQRNHTVAEQRFERVTEFLNQNCGRLSREVRRRLPSLRTDLRLHGLPETPLDASLRARLLTSDLCAGR